MPITKNCTSRARYVGYGERNVEYPDSYYLQANIKTPVLDSDGNPVLDGDGNPVETITSEFIFDSNGYKILEGVESPYQLDSNRQIILDSDENPTLDPNWRTKIIQGIATQLDDLATNVVGLSIQAKFTNLGKIWILDQTAERYRGIYLFPNSAPYTMPNATDLRNVYIIGNAGEGVVFTYGTNSNPYLSFLGETLTFQNNYLTFRG